MQQAQRSSLGLLISLLVHGAIVGALWWNWHKPSDSANNHAGELSTSISMEMIQGMRIAEPEPKPQKSEPEPPKEDVVADPTKKPEPEKKKEQEKPKDKPKLVKEKPKKEVKPQEKKQELPKNLLEGDRNVNSSATANSKATTTSAVNTNANMAGTGTNTDEIAAYKAALYREIERRKDYPTRAKMMRKQGVVSISFKVGADGSLSGEAVAKSSGDESLDNAALKAVRNARAVGPKPAGFPTALSIPIRFTLQ